MTPKRRPGTTSGAPGESHNYVALLFELNDPYHPETLLLKGFRFFISQSVLFCCMPELTTVFHREFEITVNNAYIRKPGSVLSRRQTRSGCDFPGRFCAKVDGILTLRTNSCGVWTGFAVYVQRLVTGFRVCAQTVTGYRVCAHVFGGGSVRKPDIPSRDAEICT